MFNRIQTRVPLPGVPAAPAATQDINAVLQGILAANQAAINASTEATNKLVAAMLAQSAHQYSFSKYPTIDLTVAHTNLEITVIRPVSFIQVWSDGGLDGISVRIGQQSNEPVDFRQMQVIPVVDNPEKIYFTNDVRQGRSRAVIYFVQGPYPLSLSQAGQDISQAELAVRNGSPDIFDRRGNVIFADSFRHGIGQYQLTGSPGYIGLASTDYAEIGDTSLKLETPAVNLNYAQVTKGLPFAALSKFSLQNNFTISSLSKGIYTSMIEVYDGVNYANAIIRYDASTSKYQYLNSVPAFVDLATAKVLYPTVAGGVPIFHKMKLVIDKLKNSYVRIIIDSDQYEIPTFPIRVSASVTNPYLAGTFLITATDATAITSYLNLIEIKQDEP
jgi:hypothetical protein